MSVFKDILIPKAQSVSFFFKRQVWHFLCLLVLIPVAWAFADPVLGDGGWLGVSDAIWFWSSIALAVLHQLLVWLVFRGQLGWGLLSRLFGRRDLFFWGLIFLPLLVARPITLIGLAVSDRGSLALPRPIELLLGVILLIPAVYALYSVKRYFGLARALGGDHFRLKYREMPLVRQGAYRWSGNAMYAFVFLMLWSIALIAASQAALSLALFQHAYVWVHYFCTEEPDMNLIYAANI